VSQSTNNLAFYIWSLADLLRGDFKQSQYGRIILPFTLLRRLECVVKANKADVLAQADKLANSTLPEEAKEKMLLRASKLSSSAILIMFFLLKNSRKQIILGRYPELKKALRMISETCHRLRHYHSCSLPFHS
jgi:type I restriction-modification system DNA methylase subunit